MPKPRCSSLILVAILLSGAALVLVAPQAAAVIHALPKLSDCYNSADSAVSSGLLANACDDNDATSVLFAGNPPGTSFPHWIVFNLSQKFRLDHVAVKWNNYPGNGHVDIWTGSSWVAYANFTNSGAATNQTINLDVNVDSQKVRLYYATDRNGLTADNFFGLFEIWIYGDVIPSTFTLTTASSTVSFLAGNQRNVTVLVNTTTGYNSTVTIYGNSSNVLYFSVVCFPTSGTPNYSTSCSLFSSTPGIYTATITGVGPGHSSALSIQANVYVTGTQDIRPMILLAVAYVAFMFFGLMFGFRDDNLVWLIAGLLPAGIILLVISFQAWAITASFFVSVAFAMLAIVTIAYPIVIALRGMME